MANALNPANAEDLTALTQLLPRCVARNNHILEAAPTGLPADPIDADVDATYAADEAVDRAAAFKASVALMKTRCEAILARDAVIDA